MDPMTLLLPAGLFQGAILTVAACHAGSRGGTRNNLLGIRLWSTTFSDAAWQAGHRAGLKYSWALLFLALISFAIGIWLVQTPLAATTMSVTSYTLGSFISFLCITLVMLYRAHVAAKAVAIEYVLTHDADIVDAIVDQRLAEQDTQS